MSGSDSVLFWFIAVTMLLVGIFAGALAQRGDDREKFLTFCTSQNIPYVKCKEEWEKP